MSRGATKAADSIYYKARVDAAKQNERLCSREGASELIGVDRTRLAKIELETVTPYPDEVLLISDIYNAPELLNHHCTHCCPIGRRTVVQAELQGIDRITISLLSAVGNLESVSRVMISIAEDGTLSANEVPMVKQIINTLGKIEKATTELKILVAKTEGGI